MMKKRKSREKLSVVPPAVSAAVFSLLCSSHSVWVTHMLGALSLSYTHTSVNSFNSPAVPDRKSVV